MSTRQNISDMLVSMGFPETYINRAFKVYEKNYGNQYNVEVITEIIVRLQNKDKKKKLDGDSQKSPSKQKSPKKIKSKSPRNSFQNQNQSQNQKPKPKIPKPAAVAASDDIPPPAFSMMYQPIDNSNMNNILKPNANPSLPSDIKKSPLNRAPTDASRKKKKKMPPPPPFHEALANNGVMVQSKHGSQNSGQSGQFNVNNQQNYMGSLNMDANMGNMPNMANMGNMGMNMGDAFMNMQNQQMQNQQMQQQMQNQQMQNQQMQHQQMPNLAQAQAMNVNMFHGNKPIPPVPNMQNAAFNIGDTVIQKFDKTKLQGTVTQVDRNAAKFQVQFPNGLINWYSAHELKKSAYQYSPSPSQSKPNSKMGNQPRRPIPAAPSSKKAQRHSHKYAKSGNVPKNQSDVAMQQMQINSVSMGAATNLNKKLPPAPPAPMHQVQIQANKGRSSKRFSKKNKQGLNFEEHMSKEEAEKLRVHDKIDHRDQVGRFVFATVVEKSDTNLKIHYDGWSRKWDTWSDYALELKKFAKAGTISKMPPHRFKHLKKGDYVDLNPILRHPGWKCGEIRRLDQLSGQVQVVYECNDKNYLYWAHLDNRNEIAEFTSKSGTNQSNQINIASKFNQKGGGGNQFNNKQQGPQVQHSKKHSKNQQKQPLMTAAEQMMQLRKIRAKRFPLLKGEMVDNPYNCGDWLEVQDTQTSQWVTATVIDKENNWIVVHFDGWPSKYDQKIHCVKHKLRLRALGSGLQKTKEEREIKEEMDNFLEQLESFGWQIAEVDADGNCLYRCFATEIYDDTDAHLRVRKDCCDYMRQYKVFFQNFIPDFDARMTQKEQEFEWGDHVDITALSELYNVRVRVFEYSHQDQKLYMSFDQGQHEETLGLPLILLARHHKKHYNVIIDPNNVFPRPLGDGLKREAGVSLRELRFLEDAQAKENEESKDEDGDGKENDDDDAGNNRLVIVGNLNIGRNRNIAISDMDMDSDSNNMRSKISRSKSMHDNLNIHKKQFSLHLTMEDWNDVMNTWTMSEPLGRGELENAFLPLVNKLHKKVKKQWLENHQNVDIKIMERSWEGQFNQKMTKYNCKKWIKALLEKCPSGKFPMKVCLLTFNQIISDMISSNLGSVVVRRKSQYDANSMDIESGTR